ncbi:MAG: hypothetical protein JJE39_03795 [Vicinamibacteria bacterium]|nr:hypothetical protein [Vicinamibacteria bacterium]
MKTPIARRPSATYGAMPLALAIIACSGPRPATEVSRAIQAEDHSALERLLKAGHSPEAGELRPIV